MVFVVNHSLKMGVGKIASQVAHAAVLLFQQLQERERDIETLFRWHEIGCVLSPLATCDSRRNSMLSAMCFTIAVQYCKV